MLSDIEITKYTRKSRCDIRRCSARSEYSIGAPGESQAVNFIVCGEHLKQIVLKGMPIIAECFGDDLLNKIGSLAGKGADTKALNSEIERLKLELEAAETEIRRLSVELEAARNKHEPVGNNVQNTPKGVKRK